MYDVSGKWSAHQNDGFVVNFEISQNGAVFTGLASHSFGAVSSTALDGSIVGDIFTMIVVWDDGSSGQYSGFFTGLISPIAKEPNPKRLVGITFDTNLIEKQTTWVSSKVFEDT